MKKLLLSICLIISATPLFSQYTVSNVITGLPYPVTFQFHPDGRYYIALKGGDGFSSTNNAKVNIYSTAGALLGTLWDFTDSTETYFERGVLGVAIDPDWASNNYVYVFYNHNYAGQNRIRVVRFTEVNNIGTNPTIILDITDPHSAGNHTGGNIHFRPTEPNQLYITIGDRATQANSQNLANPFGKILRINKDGTIPTDNPFYDDGNPATGNDDRIYSYGHRNSFDFTFSTINDSLYASENGLNTWDEVNQISPGNNYGWPTCEGFYLQGSTSSPCTNPAYTAPMDDWGSPLPAITGIIIYNHTLMPEFLGHMIVVDYDYGNLEDFTLSGTGMNVVANRTQVPINLGTLDQLTDINQGPDGCIYVIHGGYTSSGIIRKICPVGMGVSELEQETLFSLCPNPTNGNVTLSLEENQINSALTIRDISGRVVQNQIISGTKIVVDCSQFAKGTYFVSVENVNGSVNTQKLIIQ